MVACGSIWTKLFKLRPSNFVRYYEEEQIQKLETRKMEVDNFDKLRIQLINHSLARLTFEMDHTFSFYHWMQLKYQIAVTLAIEIDGIEWNAVSLINIYIFYLETL